MAGFHHGARQCGRAAGRGIVGTRDGDGDGLLHPGPTVIGRSKHISLGDHLACAQGLGRLQSVDQGVGPHACFRIDRHHAVGGRRTAFEAPGACGVGVHVADSQGPTGTLNACHRLAVGFAARFHHAAAQCRFLIGDHGHIIGAHHGDGEGLIYIGPLVVGGSCHKRLGDTCTFGQGLCAVQGVVQGIGPQAAGGVQCDPAV